MAQGMTWRRLRALLAVFVIAVVPPVSAREPAGNPHEVTPYPSGHRAEGEADHNAAAFWREVRSGEAGLTQARGAEAGVLVYPRGETWRELRSGPITIYGGALILAVAFGIWQLHVRRGPIGLSGPPTGRVVVRFDNWERLVHWLVAVSFVLLGLTGLVLLFGRHSLIFFFGHVGFSWLAAFAKNCHNFTGPLFAAGIVAMLITFARDNVWQSCDALWIRRAGGLLRREHVPSMRFNFGEKTWFWFGVFLLGLTQVASGLVMVLPNIFDTRWAMQTASVIHAVAGIVLIALSLGHIYMGTVGVEGAYRSMVSGEVDERWAEDHHGYWLADVKRRRAQDE
jgi:formate dehydrogenase subunit gamma